MKVLVIGGGGREHAIVRALMKSPRITKLYCAPGNGGIAQDAECVPIEMDNDSVVSFARAEDIGFVVVGPEGPLAGGMVDALETAGIKVFGPRANAAVIESSKAFSKDLMTRYNIPTAAWKLFDDRDEAVAYVNESSRRKVRNVIKADGLAQGKGVVVAETTYEAEDAIIAAMDLKRFGDSGNRVVIEDFITGTEVSVLCFTDGKTIIPMLSAQDHKRVFDNDLGPNTGGMGAFCPSPVYTPDVAEYCMEHIYLPTMRAMNKEGRTFKGIIYFGLMLTEDGPKVVEYNARFGDPEAQPILTMLKTDLLDILEAVVEERLSEIKIEWKPGFACCVVMCSGGYPITYETGYEIFGLDETSDETIVYHSGTALKDGRIFTSGGRVLGVTSTAMTLGEAARSAYRAVEGISFSEAHYRKDIGGIYS